MNSFSPSIRPCSHHSSLRSPCSHSHNPCSRPQHRHRHQHQQPSFHGSSHHSLCSHRSSHHSPCNHSHSPCSKPQHQHPSSRGSSLHNLCIPRILCSRSRN